MPSPTAPPLQSLKHLQIINTPRSGDCSCVPAPQVIVAIFIIPSADSRKPSPTEAIAILTEEIVDPGSVFCNANSITAGADHTQNLTATLIVQTVTLCYNGVFSTNCPDSIGFPSKIYFLVLSTPPVVYGTNITITINTTLFGNLTSNLTSVLSKNFSGKSPALTGTVRFYDDTGALVGGTAIKLNSQGVATLTFSPSLAASHTYAVYYLGDPNYKPGYSLSFFSVTVVKGATNTSISPPSSSVAWIQKVVLLISVKSANALIPTGNVTVTSNLSSDVILIVPYTIPLNSTGYATFSSFLPTGTYHFSCTYNGDSNFNTSQTNTAALVVVAKIGVI